MKRGVAKSTVEVTSLLSAKGMAIPAISPKNSLIWLNTYEGCLVEGCLMGVDQTYTSINPPVVFAAGMPVVILGETLRVRQIHLP